MGKIIYLALATSQLNTELLDICSSHSNLVEPLGESDLLLDLSPFNQIAEVLELLTMSLTELETGAAFIGLASSPLLAMLAVKRQTWNQSARDCCRRRNHLGIDIIQIITGREADFMKTLLLEEFPPLTTPEVKKLKRLGYSLVGDLAALGAPRLQKIIKRDASTLWHNSRGRDYRPVKGLYPLECLGYSLALEDNQSLQPLLKNICRELTSLLAERHVACQNIRIHLELGDGQTLVHERQLSCTVSSAIRLEMIVQGLLSAAINQPVTALQFFLTGLEPLQMKAQDLFTLRWVNQKEAQSTRVDQLIRLFPGTLELGMEIERREEVLRFWDPWRFLPEVKHETSFTYGS